MDNNRDLIRYLKILLSAYLVIGLILIFSSSMVLDLSLNILTITGIFVACTLVYGVLIRNKNIYLRQLLLPCYMLVQLSYIVL
ncbi:hypothetical protein DFH59_000223 [Clostridium beijerinckii]|nr:hypothetical protein [Clostridium beijerinckii]